VRGARQACTNPLARTAGAWRPRRLELDLAVVRRATWRVAVAGAIADMPDDVAWAFAAHTRSVAIALTHDPKLDDLALLEALPGATSRST